MGSALSHRDRKQQKNKAKITVTLRKRPLTAQEEQKGEGDILKCPSHKTIVVAEPRKAVTGISYTENHEFAFDRVYDETVTNMQIYDSCIKLLVDSIFENGGKCACFAFGQTGSGKTYTMVGPSKLKAHNSTALEHRGLWEWAANDIINWMGQPRFREHKLYLSFLEIYCNRVYDLLGERKLVRALETKTESGVVVKDLTNVQVFSEDELLKYMEQGLTGRVVAKNSRNTDSSRGHAILTIEIRSKDQTHGKLAFIDLAGSERGADTLSSGRTTQQDGAGINKSLLALKECIRALDQQSSHVPFRDSELTKVLRDIFLSEGALTVMIANVCPTATCCEQTLNTLRYAQRVIAMRKNAQPCINEPSSSSEESEPCTEEVNSPFKSKKPNVSKVEPKDAAPVGASRANRGSLAASRLTQSQMVLSPATQHLAMKKVGSKCTTTPAESDIGLDEGKSSASSSKASPPDGKNPSKAILEPMSPQLLKKVAKLVPRGDQEEFILQHARKLAEMDDTSLKEAQQKFMKKWSRQSRQYQDGLLDRMKADAELNTLMGQSWETVSSTTSESRKFDFTTCLRELAERKIANLTAFGHVLANMEKCLAISRNFDKEFQRRSLESVKFYSFPPTPVPSSAVGFRQQSVVTDTAGESLLHLTPQIESEEEDVQ